MKNILMTCLSVCSLGVSCNEMIDAPMLLVVLAVLVPDKVWSKIVRRYVTSDSDPITHPSQVTCISLHLVRRFLDPKKID